MQIYIYFLLTPFHTYALNVVCYKAVLRCSSAFNCFVHFVFYPFNFEFQDCSVCYVFLSFYLECMAVVSFRNSSVSFCVPGLFCLLCVSSVLF